MRWFLLLFLLLFIPLVSADVIISPNPVPVSLIYYTPTVFGFSIVNNNNFSVRNFVFSPVPAGFTFPPIDEISPNSSRIYNFSVVTNSVFSGTFISQLSFFYSVPIPPAVVSVDVNVSPSGFSVIPVLFSDDSIVWHNLLNSSVNILDVGSNFSSVSIPPSGSVLVNYSGVHNYSFYSACSLGCGLLGSFQIVSRPLMSWVHDSSLDRTVSFNVVSNLPSSSVDVLLLSNNISVNNNATYLNALIQVRNNDLHSVIQNVHLSADRWVNNFSVNDFSLPVGGVQTVYFNISPFVDRTNLTNRSSNIVLSVNSSAGSTFKVISVFINYQNLDLVNIGGVNYTLTFLSINQTADACRQHRLGVGLYDLGFEACKQLEVLVNQTIVQQVPCSYEFSQAQVKSYADSWTTLGGVAQRLENKQNLYLDRQALTNLRVDNLTSRFENFSEYVLQREAERDVVVSNHNLRFWLLFSFAIIFLLASWLIRLLSNIELFNALERAGQ